VKLAGRGQRDARRAKTALRATFPAWRSRLVLGVLTAAFLGLVARAAYLQGVQEEFLQAKGEARYSRVREIPASRGRILDRAGEPLAVSTPMHAVWALPGMADPSPREIERVAELVELTPRELRKRLADTERDQVPLNRAITAEAAQALDAMRLPWIKQENSYRRFYPGGEVMAHVLGFTNVDDVGQEGVELAFQNELAGAPGKRRIIRDRKGKTVEELEIVRRARDGRDIVLALDSRVQNLVFRALKQAVSDHRARGAGAIVVDTTSGEVLALVNLPTFNPNNRGQTAPAQMRNRAIVDIFEPGSTLKPFTVALALEQGKLASSTVIQTGPGSLTIGGATIRDVHPGGAMTVAEVIQKSSNVGSAKIALEHLAPQEMWRMFDDAGFGTAPRLGFPGEATGRVRPYKTWRPIEQATMSYGHGIAVSLVQLARAYTAFARDGDLIPLSLVRVDEPPAGRRFLSAATAQEMRRMLEAAVSPKGTAPRAQIMGYRVAGKTGTAHKLEGGGYASDKYISSFVGFAPASKPRLVIAVMIDEPRAGQHYGGLVAAPVFAQMMQGALRLLGVPYDAPLEPIRLPAAGDEIHEST
jgi:cell division protein FtsI (penicillin-binding protein 3)